MAMTRADAWQSARRILAVRLDNLGDVLMSTPALRALRESGAERHVTLLCSPAGAAVQPYVPEIDALMVATPPWLPGSFDIPESLDGTVASLRAARFDAAVIFTVYSQSALPAAMLCWMAGIPLRLAYCRENPYALLSDWVADPEPHEILRHEVRRQLDLVAGVGCRTTQEGLSFRIPPREMRSAMEKLRTAGIDPARRWLVLHPGASAASRRYPAEHYAALVQLLGEMSDVQLVFTGEHREADLIAEIRKRGERRSASLAGMLGLGELAAVIARSALLISNNTGPVHIAAAVGTAVVDIYALTNPQHAPWQVASRVLFHDVPCRFCYRSSCPQQHHACLRLLEPERVARAARELLLEGKAVSGESRAESGEPRAESGELRAESGEPRAESEDSGVRRGAVLLSTLRSRLSRLSTEPTSDTH